MKSCIYARTCRKERPHHTTSIENQVEFGREVARRYNLSVEPEHVFTDIEKAGALPPTCWADDGGDSRPALAALILTVEDGAVAHVLVHRLENLGSSSEVLVALRDLFVHYGVTIVTPPELLREEQDPRGAFALSVLRPCLQVYSDVDLEQIAKRRTRKEEEIARLKGRIARLEAEIDELVRPPL